MKYNSNPLKNFEIFQRVFYFGSNDKELILLCHSIISDYQTHVPTQRFKMKQFFFSTQTVIIWKAYFLLSLKEEMKLVSKLCLQMISAKEKAQ